VNVYVTDRIIAHDDAIIENCCQSLQLFGNARVQQDVFVDSRKKKNIDG
jgi:hypothetical protein